MNWKIVTKLGCCTSQETKTVREALLVDAKLIGAYHFQSTISQRSTRKRKPLAKEPYTTIVFRIPI